MVEEPNGLFNFMKTLHVLALFLCLTVWSGCKSTLQEGGAYNSGSTNSVVVKADLAFFVVDSAYELAHATIDAAFTFEKNNRALLWDRSKSIKHELDAIRPQAVAINGKYLTARAAYLANPVPDNLTKLQAILVEIQRLATSTAAVLPK